MKNTKKWIFSLSALALCCMASGSALSAVKASAAEVNNTVNTVNFQIVSGAAIRIDSNAQDGKDENGIRYQITMPDSEYKALESNSAYDSVSYGILIAPNEYVTKYGELNKTNVFGEEAVYDWAVKNENGNWVYEGDGSKTRIMNFESDTLSPYSKNETVRTYFGSIVNLDETNIPRDFVGVGYIKYTKGSVTDYVFAQANDNVRSMSQVARLAYADTSATALDQTTKDAVKKTYIDDVFGNSFEFNSAKDAYLSVNDKNASIVTDGNVKGLKATVSQIKNNQGRQDLRINVGGEYQFKQIQKIVVKYKVAESNNDGWWRLFFNDNTTEGQHISKTTGGVTFTTETGRQSEVMSTYCTLTIEPAIANSATGLSGDDYFYAINIGYRDEADRAMTMIIDSVVVYTGYKAEYLNFNETASLCLVTGLNVSFVEDAGCTDGKGVKGSFARDDKTSQSLKINLGGVYTIGEIDHIVIRYKMTEGNNGWYRLYANGKKDKDDYRLQSPNIVFASSTSSQAKPMNDYSKITINQAAFTASAGPALAETDTLDSLEFWFGGWQGASGSTSTLIIDSITIVLK